MRLRFLAVSLVWFAAGSAGAQSTASKSTQAGKSPELRVDFTRETLPNGLNVIYHVDHTTPVAAVLLIYNVGSKMEQPGKTGFAHLFEHMMFKGSKNVADGQHFALLEAAGGRAGSDINGTTNWDRTNYFEQIPSNQLELALWLESDRMGTLTQTLTQGKLDNQREVVKNERRQSIDNQPYGTWLEKTEELLFPEGHPYHHSVMGSMEDLSAASVADVQSFFKTYYAPNNAVLVLAGDIDVPQAKEMVRRYFGPIPRGPVPPKLANMSVPTVVGHEQRVVIQDALAPAPRVYVSYRVPPLKDRRSAAVSMLATIIGGGSSSRLDESLVRRQQIATSVSAFNLELVDGGDILFVQATGKPGSSPDSLEHALLAELAGTSSFTQAEFDRAKASARFQFVDGLQTTGGFGGRADRLAEGWTYFHDANHVNTILGEIDRVTLADVNALARERLVSNNRAILVYVPVKKTASETVSGRIN
ncbi:MAG TPA: pitrilysin family protein [Gemmatimonadaceae bacterium]|nr:pitrilysin family protein [Gemmatimonadaceae bacterium]